MKKLMDAALMTCFVSTIAFSQQTEILRVQVMKSGSISLNGQTIGLSELKIKLNQNTGPLEVWYYREAPETTPSDSQMEVIKAAAERRAIISLSSKPDFSDYIGEDGQSHPRNN